MIVEVISSRAADSTSEAFSSLSANSENACEIIVLSTMFASATFACEPSILNSNLLPVNAKGEVLFLSDASLGKMGDSGTPIEPSCARKGI